MARLNETQKDNIRRRILEAARKHFINDGYEATSTKQLAAEAGIAEGTLFNYFSSKADLMLEVVASELAGQAGQEQTSVFFEDIPESVNDLVTAYLKKILVFPKRVIQEVLLAGTGIARKKPELFKKLADADYRLLEELNQYFVKAAEQGIIKQNTDCGLLAESVFAQVFMEVIFYLYEGDYQKDLLLKKIKGKIGFTVLPYLSDRS